MPADWVEEFLLLVLFKKEKRVLNAQREVGPEGVAGSLALTLAAGSHELAEATRSWPQCSPARRMARLGTERSSGSAWAGRS